MLNVGWCNQAFILLQMHNVCWRVEYLCFSICHCTLGCLWIGIHCVCRPVCCCGEVLENHSASLRLAADNTINQGYFLDFIWQAIYFYQWVCFRIAVSMALYLYCFMFMFLFPYCCIYDLLSVLLLLLLLFWWPCNCKLVLVWCKFQFFSELNKTTPIFIDTLKQAQRLLAVIVTSK